MTVVRKSVLVLNTGLLLTLVRVCTSTKYMPTFDSSKKVTTSLSSKLSTSTKYKPTFDSSRSHYQYYTIYRPTFDSSKSQY